MCQWCQAYFPFPFLSFHFGFVHLWSYPISSITLLGCPKISSFRSHWEKATTHLTTPAHLASGGFSCNPNPYQYNSHNTPALSFKYTNNIRHRVEVFLEQKIKNKLKHGSSFFNNSLSNHISVCFYVKLHIGINLPFWGIFPTNIAQVCFQSTLFSK